jgi:riboflavin synthase
MFTGIIERTGRVVSITTPVDGGGGLMTSITQVLIDAGKGFDTKVGDSVAVNGCCLTVTSNKVQMLAFDVSRETLVRTDLGQLREGDEVNLERALKVGDRLGGHIVTGHVDGLGTVEKIRKQPDGWEVTVALSRQLSRYVIAKGSICLDGVSLTVNGLTDRFQDQDPHVGASDTLISLMLIPTTVSLTSFKTLHEGRRLNVEVDTVGKFIERLVTPAT